MNPDMSQRLSTERVVRPTMLAPIVLSMVLLMSACGGGGGGSSGGGYYKDDGPPANVPANLDSIPNAIPREEALARGPNRPYTIMGKRYVPDTSGQAYRKRGMASWYGRKFHGNKTSNGERYDMFAMTAAHTTLPIPSYVRVTRVSDGRQVILRVNDRGPFLHNRVIDLSYAAAHRLGMVGPGSVEVVVERIMPEQIRAGTWNQTAPTVAAAQPVANQAVMSQAVMNQTAMSTGPVFLQLGAFRDEANARSLATRAAGNMPVNSPVSVDAGPDLVYRVRIGPFVDRAAAERAAQPIFQSLGVSPSVSAP
jgi:rare lipoprotein A